MGKSQVVMTIPAPISHLFSLGLLLTAARALAATPNISAASARLRSVR
jgi:hypothetical protein